MKKVLNFIVILLIFILLVTVWKTSLVEGSEHGRNFANPQAVRRNATLKPNVFGGHNYYVNGKKVGHSKKNLAGSYDIYIMNKLKYRGSTFQKEHKFTDAQPVKSRSQTRLDRVAQSRAKSGHTPKKTTNYNHKNYGKNSTQIRLDRIWEKRAAWIAKQKADTSGTMYLHDYYNRK